jgi:hypothetical protein
MAFKRGTAGSLRLGNARCADVGIDVGDLPVLKHFGRHAGLLGSGVLMRFKRVEIDFTRREMRLDG